MHVNPDIVCLAAFATRLSSILGDSFAARYGFQLASFRYTKNLHPNSCSPAMPTQDQTVQFLRHQTFLIPCFRHFLCHARLYSFSKLLFFMSPTSALSNEICTKCHVGLLTNPRVSQGYYTEGNDGRTYQTVNSFLCPFSSFSQYLS